jgi:hypothetical protein
MLLHIIIHSPLIVSTGGRPTPFVDMVKKFEADMLKSQSNGKSL